jgi:hypothetical protein
MVKVNYAHMFQVAQTTMERRGCYDSAVAREAALAALTAYEKAHSDEMRKVAVYDALVRVIRLHEERQQGADIGW